MAMPSSPDLPGKEASRLAHYTQRARDNSLSTQQRADARKKRAQLMLSLRRAGWPMPPIARAAGATMSVVREQIVVLPATTKSVEVHNMDGERVLPEPLDSEYSYETLESDEVEYIRGLAPIANGLKFVHGPDAIQRRMSALLDVTLAFLYDKGCLPTDMARALETSNSLVRQRIRRGHGGRADAKGEYDIPENIADEAKAMMERFREKIPADKAKAKAAG